MITIRMPLLLGSFALGLVGLALRLVVDAKLVGSRPLPPEQDTSVLAHARTFHFDSESVPNGFNATCPMVVEV